MPDRIIRTSGKTGITAESLICAALVGELLSPSPELWLVSPWISDVAGVDNTRGEFDALFLDPVARIYTLADVLAQLSYAGSRITVVTRPDDHNRTFASRLKQQSDMARCTLIFDKNVHEKTMCGGAWLVSGSMNFTVRGMMLNDEAVTYRTDAAAAATTRMDFNHRWGIGTDDTHL